jgi:hypothetical protein
MENVKYEGVYPYMHSLLHGKKFWTFSFNSQMDE